MKLANHLTWRLCSLFILIFLVWSGVYFFVQMEEIYDDLDEGLVNLKQEFILNANKDPLFVENMERYNPINMFITEVSSSEVINIKEEHSTTKVYFETEKEHEEVRLLTTAFKCESNGKYYMLKLFTSTVESDDLIENMLGMLILLWLAISLSIVIASKLIIKKSSEPFHKLLDNLQAFKLNNTKMIELPKTNISEFKALNGVVEELLKDNIEAYCEQKSFIENSSHELQTPLAVVIGKIELMMCEPQIDEEQMKELSAILSNLHRMKRLNSSLLLLSKIRNKQFTVSSNVDIRKIIIDVTNNFSDIMEHKQLELTILGTDSPTVLMNEDLAHIMINNLVKNAVAYNVTKGRILISLTEDRLTISNDGSPIDPEINIFERYTSNETENNSTGLGLSIVSSIAKLYKLRTNYEYNTMHEISIFF